MRLENVLASLIYCFSWSPRGLIALLWLVDRFKNMKLPHGNPAKARPSLTIRRICKVALQSPSLKRAAAKVGAREEKFGRAEG